MENYIAVPRGPLRRGRVYSVLNWLKEVGDLIRAGDDIATLGYIVPGSDPQVARLVVAKSTKAGLLTRQLILKGEMAKETDNLAVVLEPRGLDGEVLELLFSVLQSPSRDALTNLLKSMQLVEQANNHLQNPNDSDETTQILASLEEAMQVSWPSWLAYHLHGKALYNLKCYQEAISSFQKSIDMNPASDLEAYRLLNWSYVLAEKTQEGWDYFDNLRQEKPERWEIWHHCGELSRELKNLNETIKSFKQAITLHRDPNWTFSVKYLADSITESSQFQLGVEHFGELTEKYSDYWPLWHQLGWFQWNCKSYKEAEASFRQAIAIHDQGGDFWTWLHLGNLCQSQNMLIKAVDAYTQAIAHPQENNADLWQAWKGLGDAYKQLGQYKSAIPTYEEAIKHERQLPELLFSSGFCLEKEGQLVRAFESYSQSLKADSKYHLSRQARDALVVTLRRRMLEFIDKRFDREDLRSLCFHLHVDYDNLPAEGKYGKARELIAHQERISDPNYHAILNLINEIRAMRPGIPLP